MWRLEAKPLNYQPAEHFDPFIQEWGLSAARSSAQLRFVQADLA